MAEDTHQTVMAALDQALEAAEALLETARSMSAGAKKLREEVLWLKTRLQQLEQATR